MVPAMIGLDFLVLTLIIALDFLVLTKMASTIYQLTMERAVLFPAVPELVEGHF